MSNVENLPTVYEPQAVEPEVRAAWVAGNYFHADPKVEGEAYCIVIPPPKAGADGGNRGFYRETPGKSIWLSRVVNPRIWAIY